MPPRRFYLDRINKLKHDFMNGFFGPEPVNNIRIAPTLQGVTVAAAAPNARQTFVPAVGTKAPGVSAQLPGKVPAIVARNGRQTHIS